MKEKFIHLRSLGVSIAEIARILNISLPLCKKYSVKYSAEVKKFTALTNLASFRKIDSQIDGFLAFLIQQFEFVKSELLQHDEIYLDYNKCIVAVNKILTAYSKIVNLKNSINHSSFDESPSESDTPDETSDFTPEELKEIELKESESKESELKETDLYENEAKTEINSGDDTEDMVSNTQKNPEKIPFRESEKFKVMMKMIMQNPDDKP